MSEATAPTGDAAQTPTPLQQLVSSYQARQAAESAQPAATETTRPDGAAAREAQTDRIDAAKDKIEKQGEDAPKQKDGESDKDYELRLSRVSTELKRARTKNQELERKLAELEAKGQKADEELSKPKAARMKKSDYIKLTRDLAENKVKIEDVLETDDLDDLPPGLRKQLQDLIDFKTRHETEQQTRQGQEIRQREVAVVANQLEALADECPLFVGREGFAEKVLDLYYEDYAENEAEYTRTKSKPDLHALIKGAHEGLANTLRSALKSEAARKFLFSDPELKTLIGQKQEQPAGPTSDARGNPGDRNDSAPLSSHSAPPNPNRPLTEEEERAAMHERFLAWQRERRKT
jgi:hypothetical protein